MSVWIFRWYYVIWPTDSSPADSWQIIALNMTFIKGPLLSRVPRGGANGCDKVRWFQDSLVIWLANCHFYCHDWPNIVFITTFDQLTLCPFVITCFPSSLTNNHFVGTRWFLPKLFLWSPHPSFCYFTLTWLGQLFGSRFGLPNVSK